MLVIDNFDITLLQNVGQVKRKGKHILRCSVYCNPSQFLLNPSDHWAREFNFILVQFTAVFIRK